MKEKSKALLLTRSSMILLTLLAVRPVFLAKSEILALGSSASQRRTRKCKDFNSIFFPEPAVVGCTFTSLTLTTDRMNEPNSDNAEALV